MSVETIWALSSRGNGSGFVKARTPVLTTQVSYLKKEASLDQGMTLDRTIARVPVPCPIEVDGSEGTWCPSPSRLCTDKRCYAGIELKANGLSELSGLGASFRLLDLYSCALASRS